MGKYLGNILFVSKIHIITSHKSRNSVRQKQIWNGTSLSIMIITHFHILSCRPTPGDHDLNELTSAKSNYVKVYLSFVAPSLPRVIMIWPKFNLYYFRMLLHKSQLFGLNYILIIYLSLCNRSIPHGGPILPPGVMI